MRTLILGFDAFSPHFFERLDSEGKTPNLHKYVQAGGYARFSVSNPPQSEVSWSSIATGLNPGGHGLFDFVHRNPANYALHVSLLPTKQGVGGTQFIPPHHAHTIFDEAVKDGYPASALWWPATFPARPESPVHTIPGLGAPDIFGRLGVGVLFSTEADDRVNKTQFEKLDTKTKDHYVGQLQGPARQTLGGTKESALDLSLEIREDNSARLTLGKQAVELAEGVWSPVIELSFKMGLGISVKAVTRAILTQAQPIPRLYFLPLQIHPLKALWRYATPGGFMKKAWKSGGPFLTLGWPQDTTGLEEGCISDRQFLDLCDSILEARTRVFMGQLDTFQEGLLACVFDTLDRVQHMFWRDRPDVIEGWYLKLDALLGQIEQRLTAKKASDTRLLIVSDHGFTNFDYKVNLNRWLIEQGYLKPQEAEESGDLKSADWSESKAYAVGLNSLYLNLAGREGQGIVPPDQKSALLEKLRGEMAQWKGPDGGQVVQKVWTQEEAFEGPLAEYGPDLVVGYAPGYRASAQTGLGGWEKDTLEPNRDHWGADHCIDPSAVEGVLFSNQGLQNFPNPSYRDFPALAIGKSLDAPGSAPPPTYSDEDEEILEERLKDLGYL